MGPVPVPVLERGAYAGANAVRVNAALAIQPRAGMPLRDGESFV
ncbi:hypothetical protein XHV734_1465 [Xanthomonas hortorum pv. vitians]|nr:hypothetical protein XHV734_1465 [Xanthomonas hortorum pv. vitians]